MPESIVTSRFAAFIQEFIHDSKSVGILLLCCTAVSLIIANTTAGTAYIGLMQAESHFLHQLHLPHTAGHFINDGLMAVFFFLVGLEIKREVTQGELSSLKQAMLPVGAAIGGMIVPAFLYIVFNRGTEFQAGWGIPMATDIAFSLGVAAMLGSKFPPALKLFLTALAIVDDLGAIAVIAFFYGGTINVWWLLPGAFCILLLWALNRKKVRFQWFHVLIGLLLWYAVFNSGIHATVAGVLFAFMVPKNQLEAIEHAIHKPVNFFILPLFALANTAIPLNISLLAALNGSLSLGIFAGLFVGKPIGIFLGCAFMVQYKIASLPQGIVWADILGAGVLAGIGFTMSIFIAALAFTDVNMQDISKLVVLISALLSIATVFILMYFVQRKRVQVQVPQANN